MRIQSAALAAALLTTPAFAREISGIPGATATQLSCQGPDYRSASNPAASFETPSCQSCSQAIEREVEQANRARTAGQAAAARTSNSAAAGTAAAARNLRGRQEAPQFSTQNVNQQATQALNDQASQARSISEAMKKCAEKIRQECSGKVGGNDQQKMEEAARSCEQAGQQADQVASEKAAKAGEADKNANQAEKNGQGMQPPQAPQGQGNQASGAGEGAPTGISDSQGAKSDGGSTLDKAAVKAEGTNLQTGGSGRSGTGRVDPAAATGQSSSGGGASPTGSSGASRFNSELESGIHPAQPFGTGGSGSGGLAGGSGGGAGGKSARAEKENEILGAVGGASLENAAYAEGGGGFTGPRNMAGLSAQVNEAALGEMLGDESLLSAEEEPYEEDIAAADHEPSFDESLFRRVKQKLRSVSLNRGMQ